jgi:hypothetical protein
MLKHFEPEQWDEMISKVAMALEYEEMEKRLADKTE